PSCNETERSQEGLLVLGDDLNNSEARCPARLCITILAIVVIVLSPCSTLRALRTANDTPLNPELISVFPLGGQQGTVIDIEIRGKALNSAYGVYFDGDNLKGTITKIEPAEMEEEAKDGQSSEDTKVVKGSTVAVRVQVDQSTAVGS